MTNQDQLAISISPRLVTIACAALIVAYAAVLMAQIGKPAGWLFDDKGRGVLTDYVALWGGGKLALEGRAAEAYDWDVHRAAMAAALGWMPPALQFPYPPTFLAVVAPLAAMPVIPSMLIFGIVSLALYAFVMARVVGRPEGALWMCAPLLTFANFNVGQNGFLTAALMGGGLLVLQTRPVAAGILFGALSFKPHLGLLIPLVLVATGRWRAFGAAVATVSALVVVSVALFGLAPWPAFFGNLGKFGGLIASEQYDVAFKLQSLYGLLSTLGVGRQVALAAQAIFALGLAGLIVAAWRSLAAYELKAALLAVATVLVSPYVFFYDLTMLAVALAFFVRYAMRNGVDSHDMIGILAVNMLLLMFLSNKFPVGFLASLVLGAMVLRHMGGSIRMQVQG